MTSKETYSSGSEPTRRDVLRSVGSIGVLSSIGDIATEGVGSLIPLNIGYHDDSGHEAAANLADSVVRNFDFNAATITVPEQLLSGSAIETLADDDSIRYVEPDRTMAAFGQSVPWGVGRVGTTKAHNQDISGSGVDIAILDTGIDSTHPDLRENLGKGASFSNGLGLLSTKQKQANQSSATARSRDDQSQRNYSRLSGLLSGSTSPKWQDEIGHGTHCAGVASATDNSEGVIGVSPDSTLHAVRVLSSVGFGAISDIAAGIDYVVKQGWDVANLSLGSPRASKVVGDACSHAFEQGTLVVAAAGNSGPCDNCVKYPAAHPHVLSVGATNEEDELAALSTTGPELDILAPGTNIRSTYPSDEQPYEAFSGTSMAAPHIAGAGALLMADGYDNAEAAKRLTETATDVGLSEKEGGAGLVDIPVALDI